jgi:hypothetical protein
MTDDLSVTDDPETRVKCYRQIRTYMQSVIRRYYAAHPERQDDRGKEAVHISLEGLEAIFKILDGFLILPKKTTTDQ